MDASPVVDEGIDWDCGTASNLYTIKGMSMTLTVVTELLAVLHEMKFLTNRAVYALRQH